MKRILKIKNAAGILLCSFVFVVIIFNTAYSGTDISLQLHQDALDAGLTLPDFGLEEMGVQVQDTTDLNGPYVADAFALANILGYPIGKAYLGSFPHFEIGISVGAGLANMGYYDDENPASDNNTLPAYAPNPVIHVGLGLAGGFDLLGKMFYISKSAINKYKKDVDYESDVATLNDFLIYSVGAKLRYNIVGRKRFLPFYLAFGGITISLGGNFMYGKISFLGDYKYDFEGIDVNVLGTPTSVDMAFDGEFGADIAWSIFTVDTQVVAFFDVFYLFSLYSGFGLAGNMGSFDIKFSGTGQVTTTNDIYQAATGSGQVGSLLFLSKNKYRPSPVIPTYILGLEINLFSMKLNIETMVDLHNRSDVNVQGGARIQI